MVSLGGNLGNVNASSLVKSAQSLSTQIDNFDDAQWAYQWNVSSKTDADWAQYQKYLNDRITALNNSGSITSASRALTLQTTLTSANRSYISASIDRVSQQIMEGNATDMDKYNALYRFYQQSIDNDDYDEAQSLVGRLDSLSQQIQYKQQQAASTAQAQAKADAEAQAKGYSGAIAQISDLVDKLNGGYQTGGKGLTEKDLQDANKTLSSMGIQIPTNTQADLGSVIAGALDAMGTLYYQRYTVLDAVGDSSAASAYQEAADIYNGNKTVSVGGISFNYQSAQYYAEHPNMYIQKTGGVKPQQIGTDANGKPIIEDLPTYNLTPAGIMGYQYDSSGTPQPIFSDTTTGSINDNTDKAGYNQTVKDLQNAGFTIVGKDTGAHGGILVQASTNDKNKFFSSAVSQYGLDPQTSYIAYKTDSGYQFAPVVDNNGNTHLFTISKDQKNNYGVYSETYNSSTNSTSYNLIGSTGNFNTIYNNLTSHSNTPFERTGAGAVANLLGYRDGNRINVAPPTPQQIKDVANQYFGGNVSQVQKTINATNQLASHIANTRATASPTQQNVANAVGVAQKQGGQVDTSPTAGILTPLVKNVQGGALAPVNLLTPFLMPNEVQAIKQQSAANNSSLIAQGQQRSLANQKAAQAKAAAAKPKTPQTVAQPRVAAGVPLGIGTMGAPVAQTAPKPKPQAPAKKPSQSNDNIFESVGHAISSAIGNIGNFLKGLF